MKLGRSVRYDEENIGYTLRVLAEGNTVRVPEEVASIYEKHQTREMFHERILQSPVGLLCCGLSSICYRRP
jgi:hypothetical protein